MTYANFADKPALPTQLLFTIETDEYIFQQYLEA